VTSKLNGRLERLERALGGGDQDNYTMIVFPTATMTPAEVEAYNAANRRKGVYVGYYIPDDPLALHPAEYLSPRDRPRELRVGGLEYDDI